MLLKKHTRAGANASRRMPAARSAHAAIAPFVDSEALHAEMLLVAAFGVMAQVADSNSDVVPLAARDEGSCKMKTIGNILAIAPLQLLLAKAVWPQLLGQVNSTHSLAGVSADVGKAFAVENDIAVVTSAADACAIMVAGARPHNGRALDGVYTDSLLEEQARLHNRVGEFGRHEIAFFCPFVYTSSEKGRIVRSHIYKKVKMFLNCGRPAARQPGTGKPSTQQLLRFYEKGLMYDGNPVERY